MVRNYNADIVIRDLAKRKVIASKRRKKMNTTTMPISLKTMVFQKPWVIHEVVMVRSLLLQPIWIIFLLKRKIPIWFFEGCVVFESIRVLCPGSPLKWIASVV